MRSIAPIPLLAAVWLLSACGGGGGGGSPPATVLPTAALSASSTTIDAGGSATLTWSSANATSCTASGGWSGTLATSGSRSTGALTATATFSLTCAGAGGTSQPATVTVSVNPVPTATLSVTPTSVVPGGTSTLTWSSTNATACTASGGWTETLATSGTQSTGALTAAKTYTLVCSGAGGTSTPATATVNVLAATLSVYPSVIAPGASSTLTWSSTAATSCTASGGWNESLGTSGTQSTGAVSATTTYSLTCSGPAGSSAPASATLTVSSTPMSVAPTAAAITLTRTQQFAATVPGGGAATWTVDGIAGGNSTVGTVSSSGLYTAGNAGVHHIVATSVANTGQTAAASVAVTDLAGVYTYHNDVSRDGANTQEYALTTASVANSFGKLASCPVDGAIYAQPLWVANVTLGGVKHNVVFVATQHDGLFAFDADAVPCSQLWTVSLIDTGHGANAGETPVPCPSGACLVGDGSGDIQPEVGVVGTPVIDPAAGILYVVSKSVNSAQNTFYQRLHAIDITTGSEKTGSPATITASVPGAGYDSSTPTFNPQQENQRPGLALANGKVYISWASHEDSDPWYGWVIAYAYNGSAFSQTAAFNTTPNGGRGGVWMSGGAPAVDASGNVYVSTGNGPFDANSASPPNNDYGDTLLQLSAALTVNQYFTPSDQNSDYVNDYDFGAGGAAVLADLPTGSTVTHALVTGGKDGTLYVLNRDLLGGFGDMFAVQKIGLGNAIFATPALWNDYLYIAPIGGALDAYRLTPATAQFGMSSLSAHSYNFPGATPSVSASGTTNGLVWAIDSSTYCTAQSPSCGPAVLHAYDATDLATELWNSSTNASDAAGNAVKFSVPTVANGHVYVGTRGNNAGGTDGSTSTPGELEIYGLK
jgi:hypothetical protein